MTIEEIMKNDGWSIRHTTNDSVEYTHFIKIFGDKILWIDEDSIECLNSKDLNKLEVINYEKFTN